MSMVRGLAFCMLSGSHQNSVLQAPGFPMRIQNSSSLLRWSPLKQSADGALGAQRLH